MADKCPNCGTKVVKYPLKNDDGTYNWKNFFKTDLVSILFMIAVLFLILSYIHDTKECREIIEDPITYCEESNACEISFLYTCPKCESKPEQYIIFNSS